MALGPVGADLVVVGDEAIHLRLELGDRMGSGLFAKEPLERLVEALDLAAGLGLIGPRVISVWCRGSGEWTAAPSSVAAPPVRKGIKGTGRAAELARAQLRAIREEREARGTRSRSYHKEWKEWRTRWELPN